MRFFFFSVLICFWDPTLKAQELELLVVAPSFPVSWESPQRFLTSVARNRLSFADAPMGQMFAKVSCPGSDEVLLGVTSKDFGYLSPILWKGQGFGVFYHTFEGSLLKGPEITKRLSTFAEAQRLNSAKFLLSAGNCTRLLSYLEGFERLGVYRRYGFKHRPRFAEGSEAASFAVSLLEVAGLLDQDLHERWSLLFYLPLEFSGAPISEEMVNPVSFFLNARWSDDPARSSEVRIWDIGRIHEWIKQKMTAGVSEVIIDKRHFPAPEEDIWKRNFDDRAHDANVTE